MKKILFPIDFSENSFHAFEYALQLAKRTGAEILTLHVYPFDVAVFADYSAVLSVNYLVNEWSDFENYRSEVPKLKALAEKHQAGAVKMTHILERGEVVEKILETEAAENIDCIVMGTSGARGLKAVFLGSVAESVMNRASAMVLAIPSGCRFTPAQNILLLAKYEKPYLKIVRQVLQWAKLIQAHIDVLHIKDSPDKAELRTMKDWARQFEDDDIRFHVFATKDLEETAVNFADKHHNNIVAFAVHEKGFFEKLFFYSLSRRLAFHSRIPVLAIHTQKTT